MENPKQYIVTIVVATVSGFVGGVLSLLMFASPLAQLVKFKTIHAETIRIDESVESKFVHAKVIKADDYLESKVVHGKVNQGEQFFLVGKKGDTRGTWLTDTEGQPILSLYDKEQRSSAQLVITPNGSAGLWVFRKGKFSVRLMGGEIIPVLELFDETGRPMIKFEKYYGDDVPHLTFIDKKGPYKTSLVKQVTDLETYNKYIRIYPYCNDEPYQLGCERFLEGFVRFCKENPTGSDCENLKKQ